MLFYVSGAPNEQRRPGTRMKRMKQPSFILQTALFILKLQTARFRTPGELQTRDLVQNDRLDVLYLPIGVLDLENE